MPYELTTYADVVNKILIIERDINEEHTERERNQRKRARSSVMHGKNSKNTRYSAKEIINNKT